MSKMAATPSTILAALYYIASPYTHPHREMRQYRYEEVCAYAAMLMRRGMHVYSPIAHSHGMTRYGLPVEWDYWQEYDRKMLAVCDGIIVLQLKGWEQSKGVAAEIEIAKEMGKPVAYQAHPVAGIRLRVAA